MNVYLTIQEFNINNIFFQKPIENKIKNYKSFYKILYDLKFFTCKTIIFNMSDFIIYNYINHNITISNKALNTIYIIENSILNKLNILLKKKIEYSIYNSIKKKHYLFHPNKLNLNIYLRISGIWESNTSIGLTYKFINQPLNNLI